MSKESKSAESLAKKKEKASSKVEELSTQIGALSFSEEKYNSLEQEKLDLDAATAELRGSIETLTAQLEGRLSFKYSDPVRGFDRSKVKGLVARLVTVNKTEHATALEVVAGSKLYQVVVDEAITGKALLSKGKLERRVTIIPLDKIQPKRVASATCEQASEIAAGLNSTSSPAIELVGFDEDVRTAMEYVFGSTLVVDGTKAANKICDATKTRTVTLDGDVYDPSGTISGGSKNNLGTTLSKLTELSTAQENLQSKEARLSEVNAELNSMKANYSKFEKLSEKLELANAELAAVEKHLSQTKFGMVSEKHDAMVKDIEEAQAELEEMEKEQEAKWALYHQLQEQEQELTQQREEKLSQISNDVQEAKKVATEKAKSAREAESKSQTLRLELESIEAELLAAKEAVSLAEKALREANETESELQMKVGDANARYEDAKIELEQVEEKMLQFSSEVSAVKAAKDDLQRKVDSLELDAKKMKVNIAKIEKDRANAEKFVVSMLKKHSWIESEKAAFDVAGGDYDFASVDISEMKSQLEDLKSEQDSLAKKINKKVMGMIEKAEAEYTELLRKRKVVENDKKKIQAVIEELDVKKKSELERTWVKVNRDFGSIFSTLLPGSSAKLEPPEGMEAWEGLEVKVAFGDVWKESLSELSGGQRSLLALSLILSLLLFKPAPMYILDEVDAALDLSHTQNIGNMLKTHFSQSQFIVVSLKEGMFNNANVIFRTKFVDGVSTVTRTIGTGASDRARALAEANTNTLEDEEEEASPARKRSARGRRRGDKENVVN
jgi:structural maintenance of chromosome 2